MELFGFSITKNTGEPSAAKKDKELVSFVPPSDADGGITVQSAAGFNVHQLDLDGATTDESQLLQKYRTVATQPEVDIAISDIVNSAIVNDSDSAAVNIVLDNVDQPDSIKKRISDEFTTVLKLLKFSKHGSETFRKWYIEGKLYHHIIVDEKKIKDGIKEIRPIDPGSITKVREVETKIAKSSGVKTISVVDEYFLFSDDAFGGAEALKISPASIAYTPSGLLDESGKVAISYLHKSIKLVNQLRAMEDSLVIYRISRAPERRIFYIDVGNLPKNKSEEYVQSIMAKYRNKMVYDVSSGEISDDRRAMSMLEDFWLPRREGGRGTEITTLPGGDNLSQIDDVIFFQKKLYRSLNVPTTRLESDSMFSVGRVSEISREEVKFQKFINKLRKKFATLFIDILKTQCLTKGICESSEWDDIAENIVIDYVQDNFFSELKDFEILRERMAVLDEITPHIGKYYSQKWVRQNILNQSDNDIERMTNEIKDEPQTNDDDF